MNEKFNFHMSFGIFTPKLWYDTLFRTIPSTASRDEEQELEALEFEIFSCWNETEEVFNDLIPLGIYQGVEDTVSDLGGADFGDYDEEVNSNEDIEIEIVGEEEEEEEEEQDTDQHTPVELGENFEEEEDDMEMEEQQASMIQFLNDRINEAHDSFLSILDNSFSSS